jgi:PAP_fibrillin
MHLIAVFAGTIVVGVQLANVVAFSVWKIESSIHIALTPPSLLKETVSSYSLRKRSGVLLHLSSSASASVNESAISVDDNKDEGLVIELVISEQETESIPTSVQNNLSFLQTLGAITGRGEMIVNSRSLSRRKQYDAALKVVADLEAMNPITEPTYSDVIYGTWELVLSTTQLFRSSPFFIAGRAVCTNEVDAQRYNWFCDMHRAALSISSIQSIRQIITESNRMISEFETSVGAIPFLSDFTPLRYSGGLPISVTGAIVSTADITPTRNGTGWEVYMDSVNVKGSNVPILRQILDNENVGLRSRSLSDALEQAISSYKTPKPIFRTTYLDGKYRISRDEDDNIFFYVKTSNSTAPTGFGSIDADLGVGRLLEGFNDAITKFYI